MPRTRISGLGSLAADHDEQTPISASGDQHLYFAGQARQSASRRPGLEQRDIFDTFGVAYRRNRCGELKSQVLKPTKQLSHGMPGFVGMPILIHVPRFSPQILSTSA